MEIATITPFGAQERRAKGEGLCFVDVRSPAEYEAVHATGAKLYPLDTLDPKGIASELGISAQAPVVLLCGIGGSGCGNIRAEICGISAPVPVGSTARMGSTRGFKARI